MEDVMNEEVLVNNLKQLLQIDTDAIKAYEQALWHLDQQGIYEVLNQFREEYTFQVEKLSLVLSKLGIQPPKFEAIKGYFTEGFIAIDNFASMQDILEMMKSNEELITDFYTHASAWDVPAEVEAIIQDILHKGQKHLEFINQAIAQIA
jgi:hypothetical protein